MRHLEDVRQAAKRFCATPADIRVLGTDDDKAIYNSIFK